MGTTSCDSVEFFGNLGPESPSRNQHATLNPEVICPTHVGNQQIHDDYEFFGAIGHGSFGEVMVARHRRTRQLRACKVVTVRTPEQLELVRTEIELLKTLDHPNILKLHEAYFEKVPKSSATKVYLVTELCEGGDLKSRLVHHYDDLKEPMTESHIAYMMQQILSALKCCHARGIVHRDIKPENILFANLSPGSLVKIIDFGLANFVDRLRDDADEVRVPRQGVMGRLAQALPKLQSHRSNKLLYTNKRVMQRAGTASYMAPEVDNGAYDESSDMFSVGIIFCQMLTGCHPFHALKGDNRKTIRLKITSPYPVELPTEGFKDISLEAQDLCRALLDKSPRQRLTATQALAHSWFSDQKTPSPIGNTSTALFASRSFSSEAILEGLKEHQTSHKLKRAMLQLWVRELPDDQLNKLRSAFVGLHTNTDGRFAVEELVTSLKCNDASEINELVRPLALGSAESLEIGYAEFIAFLAWQHLDPTREHLQACFQKLDRRSCGRISYGDMCQALSCDSDGEAGITESEWEDITMRTGSGGMHERLELTFERLVGLLGAR